MQVTLPREQEGHGLAGDFGRCVRHASRPRARKLGDLSADSLWSLSEGSFQAHELSSTSGLPGAGARMFPGPGKKTPGKDTVLAVSNLPL